MQKRQPVVSVFVIARLSLWHLYEWHNTMTKRYSKVFGHSAVSYVKMPKWQPWQKPYISRSPRTDVVCPLIPAIQIRSTHLDGLRRPSINKWNIDDVSSSGNHHFYLARCDMCWRINSFNILEYCTVLCYTSHHHRFQIFIGFLADIYFEFYTKGNRFNIIWFLTLKSPSSHGIHGMVDP